jgi:hypothetical protein
MKFHFPLILCEVDFGADFKKKARNLNEDLSYGCTSVLTKLQVNSLINLIIAYRVFR